MEIYSLDDACNNFEAIYDGVNKSTKVAVISPQNGEPVVVMSIQHYNSIVAPAINQESLEDYVKEQQRVEKMLNGDE